MNKLKTDFIGNETTGSNENAIKICQNRRLDGLNLNRMTRLESFYEIIVVETDIRILYYG